MKKVSLLALLAGVVIVLAVYAAAATARSESGKTHRVVLSRSWTPAMLTKITDRVDAHRGISVAVERRRGVYGNRQWWFAWSDPTRNAHVAFRDWWAAELIGYLYVGRREPSALKLWGIALKTRARSESGEAMGENSHSWHPAHSYVQARASSLRADILRTAPRLGLKLASFRDPRLDGLLAPVVTLRVSDKARFKRRFDPYCVANWIFGSPVNSHFGSFLTVTDSSGKWLESVADLPQSGSTRTSRTVTQLPRARAHFAPGQLGMGGHC
jgi:hypothetical protein